MARKLTDTPLPDFPFDDQHTERTEPVSTDRRRPNAIAEAQRAAQEYVDRIVMRESAPTVDEAVIWNRRADAQIPLILAFSTLALAEALGELAATQNEIADR